MDQLLPQDFLSTETTAPGWFGKIPALGDFATRRLPPAFTERWDAWLERGLAAAKGTLGPNWLETYLHGPVWRFGLSAGLIGEHHWFGVLMPSVDRVGRYFPLTIAAPSLLPPGPSLLSLETWFEHVADAALQCLAPGASVESLERALALAPLPAFYPGDFSSPDPSGGETVIAHLPAHNGLAGAFAEAAAPLLRREYRGASFWWARSEEGPSTVCICRGLPEAAQFARLLDGTL